MIYLLFTASLRVLTGVLSFRFITVLPYSYLICIALHSIETIICGLRHRFAQLMVSWYLLLFLLLYVFCCINLVTLLWCFYTGNAFLTYRMSPVFYWMLMCSIVSQIPCVIISFYSERCVPRLFSSVYLSFKMITSKVLMKSIVDLD